MKQSIDAILEELRDIKKAPRSAEHVIQSMHGYTFTDIIIIKKLFNELKRQKIKTVNLVGKNVEGTFLFAMHIYFGEAPYRSTHVLKCR